jgi:hypothetical protein
MKKLLGLILVVCLAACKKDKNNDDCEFVCQDAAVYDSVATVSNLEGTWKWTRTGGGFVTNFCESIQNATSNVKITFNTNGSFIYVENGNTIVGTWSVSDFNPDASETNWGIRTFPEPILIDNTLPKWCSNNRLFFEPNYFIIADGTTAEYIKQ